MGLYQGFKSVSWNLRARMCPGFRRSLETESGSYEELRDLVSLSPLCFVLVLFYLIYSLPRAWLSLILDPCGRRWRYHVTKFLHILQPKADPRMRIKPLSHNSKFPGVENLISTVWARCLSWSNQRGWSHTVQTQLLENHLIDEEEV